MNAHHAITIAIHKFDSNANPRWMLLAEQAECLTDPDREEEAYGMLDDMEARMGFDAKHIAILRTALQRRFIDERILQGINQIGKAVVNQTLILGSKVPPSDLKTFGDLHDYCDANCIAGLCSDAISARADILFPKTKGEDTLASEEWMDACNAIQNALHEFIVSLNLRLEVLPEWAQVTELIGLYRKEFPDFGELDVTIPVGFIDQSWHNDACPRFERGHYQLHIDYADRTLTEFPDGGLRFMLCVAHEDNPSHSETLIDTDDWSKVEAYFADELGNGEEHSDEHPLYLQLRDTA